VRTAISTSRGAIGALAVGFLEEALALDEKRLIS